MALVVAQVKQISMASMAARLLDTNMVSGPDPGCLLSPLWQQESWTSTQTLAAAELWIQAFIQKKKA